MLTEKVKNAIDESVLCWLATVDADSTPNCSPKEVFTYFGDEQLLIADIASPQSVRNLKTNPKVCVSFVHILKQKGFKLTGFAEYVPRTDATFTSLFQRIEPLSGSFPVNGIIVMKIASVQPIIAPSYRMIKGTTEESQIASARIAYGL